MMISSVIPKVGILHSSFLETYLGSSILQLTHAPDLLDKKLGMSPINQALISKFYSQANLLPSMKNTCIHIAYTRPIDYLYPAVWRAPRMVRNGPVTLHDKRSQPDIVFNQAAVEHNLLPSPGFRLIHPCLHLYFNWFLGE
jgi:hypothetical protein